MRWPGKEDRWWDVVVHGPVSWNLVVGGKPAGKAAHLVERGVDVELHTALGTDEAARSVEAALQRAGVPFVATYVDGPTERHLNLMDPPPRRPGCHRRRP